MGYGGTLASSRYQSLLLTDKWTRAGLQFCPGDIKGDLSGVVLTADPEGPASKWKIHPMVTENERSRGNFCVRPDGRAVANQPGVAVGVDGDSTIRKKEGSLRNATVEGGLEDRDERVESEDKEGRAN